MVSELYLIKTALFNFQEIFNKISQSRGKSNSEIKHLKNPNNIPERNIKYTI